MSCTLQNVSFVLPLPPQDFFVGRTKELKKLEEILNKEAVCILKAHFPFKIGKTALANRYARDQKKVVVWINASKKTNLDKDYQKLSEKFSVDIDMVKTVLSQNSYLVIFDGVKKREILKEYLPEGDCKVIITSRINDWESSCIEVAPLSLVEAVDFLSSCTGKSDMKAAEKIALELDCLPSSLHIAAKLIIEKNGELKDYFGLREYFLERHAERLKKIGNLPERNKNFTGRELTLVSLEDAFKTDTCIVISEKKRLGVETGLGGIGKTEIALQYAYRNADKYPNYVFWINAESFDTLIASYSNLSQKLGITLLDEEKKEEKILIKKVNQKLEMGGKYLLIIDNAKDQASLKEILPQRGGIY